MNITPTKLEILPFKLFDKGVELFNNAKIEEACKVFEELVSENKKHYEGWRYWIWGLYYIGEYTRALDVVRTALELFPEDELFYEWGACIAIKLGFGERQWIENMIGAMKEEGDLMIQLRSFLMYRREGEQFGGHYYNWRNKRIKKIIGLFGPDWFEGKRILELGCGFGDIGMSLVSLGGQVTFSDGRQEYLDSIRGRYPDYDPSLIVRADINSEWPFRNDYDLILHMGLFYHLENVEFGIERAFSCTKHMILETEVYDSDKRSPYETFKEAGYDQAISGTAVRFTSDYIEGMLTQAGFNFIRHDDDGLNAEPHRYDWVASNSKGIGPKFRRFWQCKNAKNKGKTAEVCAKDLLNQAKIKRDEGKAQVAIRLLLKAILIDPKLWEAYECLGHVYYKQGSYRNALNSYEKIKNSYRCSIELWIYIGNCKRMMNSWGEAKLAYKKALEIDPHYAEALNRLGHLHYWRKQYTNAMKYYMSVLRHHYKNEEAKEYLAKAVLAYQNKLFRSLNKSLIGYKLFFIYKYIKCFSVYFLR